MTPNLKTLIVLILLVSSMLGLAYASVPLYDLFCKVTGFGGTPQQVVHTPIKPGKKVLTIRFNADTSPDLPWQFYPDQKQVIARTGTHFTTTYSAINNGNKPYTGVATFNVVPLKAAKYFKKIGCFCFDEQPLQAGEKATLPVDFFIDPKLEEDRNLKEVETITLSYTFFEATD